MIQVICCSSLLSVPGRAGAFSRDFTTRLAPECRAFSGALKIEKLKAPLIPGPEGAVDTNDWCIKPGYLQMTLFPRLGVAGISTPWPFRYPQPVKMFINTASSRRLSGTGMTSLNP